MQDLLLKLNDDDRINIIKGVLMTTVGKQFSITDKNGHKYTGFIGYLNGNNTFSNLMDKNIITMTCRIEGRKKNQIKMLIEDITEIKFKKDK